MSYKVLIKNNASNKLRSLPKEYIPKIFNKMMLLANDPRPNGCQKLRGNNNLYRIRVGVYRIIYQIEEDIRILTIEKIIHRQEGY